VKTSHFLIGIAGGSGSGKTTFLRAIFERFGTDQIALISQDNYYLSKEHQAIDDNGWVNFDLPTAIDRAAFSRDIGRLMQGETLEYHEYTFNNSDAKSSKVFVKPAPVIIMEGLFVFHYSEIFERLHYKVYVDAHYQTRLERRIRRDAVERGIDEPAVRYQWDNHVRPSEQQFLEPFKDRCHLVIDNNHNFDDGLSIITRTIEGYLEM
jgi:uridine kinase